MRIVIGNPLLVVVQRIKITIQLVFQNGKVAVIPFTRKLARVSGRTFTQGAISFFLTKKKWLKKKSRLLEKHA
jgi:hypothetical protein